MVIRTAGTFKSAITEIKTVMVRTILGFCAHVPLAALVGGIASGFQDRRHVFRADRKDLFAGCLKAIRPETSWITAREGGDPRRGTLRHDIVLRKDRARLCELVQVRRIHIGIVVPDVSPPLIICDDKNNVRLFSRD